MVLSWVVDAAAVCCHDIVSMQLWMGIRWLGSICVHGPAIDDSSSFLTWTVLLANDISVFDI